MPHHYVGKRFDLKLTHCSFMMRNTRGFIQLSLEDSENPEILCTEGTREHKCHQCTQVCCCICKCKIKTKHAKQSSDPSAHDTKGEYTAQETCLNSVFIYILHGIGTPW